MSRWDGGRLSQPQSAWVERQLKTRVELVTDFSWGLLDTRVLHVRAGHDDYVVKAGGAGNRHIPREITAHLSYTSVLVNLGRTAPAIATDRALNVLLLGYQSGIPVEGRPEEFAVHVHRQAGEVLQAFHVQSSRADQDYEREETNKFLTRLDRADTIPSGMRDDARRILTAYRPGTVVTVPTHGDWQPRNWLIDDARLRVIDFGRFDLRPAATDWTRLAANQWRADPALEAAFIDGYGSDPRFGPEWRMHLLREAIGTVVWAVDVHDPGFEAQGHQLLTDALAQF